MTHEPATEHEQQQAEPTNIIDWIQWAGFADNPFRAGHIANGLNLAELHDKPDEQKARVRLYRDWRASGVYHKKDTKSCFEKAIAGEPVPQKELIEGVLHSEANDE